MPHNNQKKIVVLAGLHFDGISSMMVNIQKNLDRDKVNFDYLVVHDEHAELDDTVMAMGSEKLSVASDDIGFKPLRRLVRMHRITKLCKKEKVRILHYNSSDTIDFTNMFAAKLGGVKHITLHSHDAGYWTNNIIMRMMFRFFRVLMPLVCDNYVGCSDLAARFMFPKSVIRKGNYTVLPNGIDLEKFGYREDVRAAVRKELGVEDLFVVGHAGRFMAQKNHAYLLDIFQKIHEKEPRSVLLLFGSGELMDSCKEKARALGIADAVRFMGGSPRMPEMWQAIDVFVMPSLHEGLPVVGVEAQAAGVPCIFSDEITPETNVTGEEIFLSLSDSPEKWADVTLSVREKPRESGVEKLRARRYDIRQTAETFENYYAELLKTV